MSTFDIYTALKAGATLYIASEALTLFPQKLVNFIEQHQITLWKGVASLLMYMARTGCLTPGSMPHLQQVLFAGETLPTKYLIDWMRAFPEKRFFNAYGPTEATGVSVCYQIDSIPSGPQQNIPIGTARDDTGILLIDDECRQVAPGEVGELCISGTGLARGYFNDPVKTARSFTITENGTRIYKTGDLARLADDGNLEFVGRKDRQLKYMGYRIEAADIEKALLAIPGVRDAAVCLAEANLNDGVKKLVAFWEADEEITSTHILAELRSRLPVHMVPKTLIPIDRMPRCSRGKIDWNLLSCRLTATP
jgi:non-ribosomal peptide synthetase component F